MSITHYLPKWLLRRFGHPLWSADIYSGHTFTKRIKLAGGDDNLWSADVEQRLMTPHDTAAAEVYKTLVQDSRRIVIPDPLRSTLANWLALFIARVPDTISHFAEASKKVDPALAIEVIRENRPRIIELFTRQWPEQCREAINVLGEEEGHRWIMRIAEQRITSGRDTPQIDMQATYERFLKTCSLPLWGKLLSQMHWQWLRTEHEFIIGDNPLIRWHEKSQRWNYGVARDVEVTFPFSSKITLRMTRCRQADNGQVHRCSAKLTDELNRRQRLAAFRYIYSGSRGVLDANVRAKVTPERRRPRRLKPE